jgi:hypothetical protein
MGGLPLFLDRLSPGLRDPHSGDRDQLAADPNLLSRDGRQPVVNQTSDQACVEAVRAKRRLRHAVVARGREHSQRPALLGSQAHRRVRGKLLPRSIQFGITVAPRLPHRVHRPYRPNDDTGTSSGEVSTLTSVLLPQAKQVAKSERTPRLRMLPSVIGLIGSSERGIGGHSMSYLCSDSGVNGPVAKLQNEARAL